MMDQEQELMLLRFALERNGLNSSSYQIFISNEIDCENKFHLRICEEKKEYMVYHYERGERSFVSRFDLRRSAMQFFYWTLIEDRGYWAFDREFKRYIE